VSKALPSAVSLTANLGVLPAAGPDVCSLSAC
jgi:hypothetical protein